MGIGLPLVGYYTATKAHGASGAKPNQNKRSAVDAFMRLTVTAFEEGWAQSIMPSSSRIEPVSKTMMLTDKNFAHKIFFDNDFELRPGLHGAIEFIQSYPSGGSLVVTSIDEIIHPCRADGLLEPSQCHAIRVLGRVPVIECGSRTQKSGLLAHMDNLTHSGKTHYEKTKEAHQIVMAALDNWQRNRKRIESVSRRCIIASLNPNDPKQREELARASKVGFACEECQRKLQARISAVYRP